MHFATRFSAALCRGLIEASRPGSGGCVSGAGFPRLYAAASLKRQPLDDLHAHAHVGFPRLYAAASLKLHPRRDDRIRHELVFRGFMPRPH